MALYRCVGGGASGTAITPDNTASPPTLTQGETYTITGNNGVAIESFSSLSPANISPKTITSGNFYRASSSGYAISSYASTSVTPSSTGVQFSAGWNRMTVGGYAYNAKPSGGTPDLLVLENGTTAISASLTGNNSSTLYAITYTQSSNSNYRADNSRINKTAGCDFSLIDTIENGNYIMRIYKLTNCQSSLQVTMVSTTSAAGKNVAIFKLIT